MARLVDPSPSRSRESRAKYGHAKPETTRSFLGVELDNALDLSEQVHL